MVENGKRKDAPSGGGDQRSKKKKVRLIVRLRMA